MGFIISEKNYNDIIYKFENGIGTITLNRPKQLNALQYPLIMEIVDVLETSGRIKTSEFLLSKEVVVAFVQEMI